MKFIVTYKVQQENLALQATVCLKIQSKRMLQRMGVSLVWHLEHRRGRLMAVNEERQGKRSGLTHRVGGLPSRWI